MRPTQQPEQGHLRWALVVDLATMPRAVIASELASLAAGAFRGRSVTVRVGRLEPSDVDYRAPHFIRDALQAGVDIVLDGSPRAIDAWSFAIKDRVDLAPDRPGRARRLQVVRIP